MSDKLTELIQLHPIAGEQAAALSQQDIQLAAAILMFEVVKSDGHVNRLEMAEVMDVLRTQFSLDGEAIGHLLEVAGDLGNHLIGLDAFTHKLRDNWGADELRRLLKDFWVIAVADRVIDKRETQLIEKIAKSLGLATQDISNARQHAQQKLELSHT